MLHFLQHCGVYSHLLSAHHASLARQLHQPFVQLPDHFWPDDLSQSCQRLGIRYFLVSNACECAIDQVRSYFSLQRVVTPVPHVLQDQQSERHFRRCLVSSTCTAIRMALSLRIVHTLDQCCVFQKLIYFFHPWFPQIFDVLGQSAVPQTWLPMPKLDHAASLISSDAAATRKATLQHLRFNRKSINTRYNALFLRRKVARSDNSNSDIASRHRRTICQRNSSDSRHLHYRREGTCFPRTPEVT